MVKDVLGLDIEVITLPELISKVKDTLIIKGILTIATVNPEFIMEAKSNYAFNLALVNSSLRIADGIGIIWAATFLTQPLKYGHQPKLMAISEAVLRALSVGLGVMTRTSIRHSVLPQQITGVDFCEAIFQLAQQNGASIFLLGERDGVAAKVAPLLEKKYPGIKIAGTFAGDGSEAGDGETRAAVQASGADIVLVAYGAPKQELWIQRNVDKIPAKVAMGVGGTFLFLSGEVKRAPAWVRSIGYEWLFRLLIQPWRWRRQLALPRFVLQVINYKVNQKSLERSP